MAPRRPVPSLPCSHPSKSSLSLPGLDWFLLETPISINRISAAQRRQHPWSNSLPLWRSDPSSASVASTYTDASCSSPPRHLLSIHLGLLEDLETIILSGTDFIHGKVIKQVVLKPDAMSSAQLNKLSCCVLSNCSPGWIWGTMRSSNTTAQRIEAECEGSDKWHRPTTTWTRNECPACMQARTRAVPALLC